MLDNGEMPPKDAEQPSADRAQATARLGANDYLHAEGLASCRRSGAGRAAPAEQCRVYLHGSRSDRRRRSTPPRSFPRRWSRRAKASPTPGNSLVMSPVAVDQISRCRQGHCRPRRACCPMASAFRPSDTRAIGPTRSWPRFAISTAASATVAGGEKVNLQRHRLRQEPGRPAARRALSEATLAEREHFTGPRASKPSPNERHLNAKYLGILWKTLKTRTRRCCLTACALAGATAKPEHGARPGHGHRPLATSAVAFPTVGHIGKVNGPKSWMERSTPLMAQQEFKLKLPESPTASDVIVYLSAGDAGDGNDHDDVIWEQPRFVAPGRPDLAAARRAARDARAGGTSRAVFCQHGKMPGRGGGSHRRDGNSRCDRTGGEARRRCPFAESVARLPGNRPSGPAKLGTPITGKVESLAGYDFIKGWVGTDCPQRDCQLVGPARANPRQHEAAWRCRAPDANANGRRGLAKPGGSHACD